MAAGITRRCFVHMSLSAVSLCTLAACSGSAENTASTDEAATTEAATTEAATTTTEEETDSMINGIDYAKGTHHATIEVADYGTITVELYASTAPITVTNFAKLASEGFYDGLTFHRIIAGFMIQGGDPNGNGTGGSSETITGEFESNGYANPISHERGTISMARSSDYNSASSQFFIMQADTPSLDGDYAAFGHVTEGMEVVDAICEAAQPTDNNGTIPAEEQPRITAIRMLD